MARSVALKQARERAMKKEQAAAFEKLGIKTGLQDEDRAELDSAKSLLDKPAPRTNPRDQESFKSFAEFEFNKVKKKMEDTFGEISVKNHFDPKPVNIPGSPLSTADTDVIMFAESGGKRLIKNPNSSAKGLFQFIDSTWNHIINTKEGKASRLTKNGRTDERQQRIAFQISTKESAQRLRSANIPVNVQTIYLAHHFGDGAAVKFGKEIFRGKNNKRLPKGFLTKEIVDANPWLKGVKTSGDFKRGLNELLRKGITDKENIELDRKP